MLEPASSRHEVPSCLVVDASCGPFMRRGLQATYRGPRSPCALRAQIATQCCTIEMDSKCRLCKRSAGPE